ncbi:MAG: hypothetical protein QHH24_05070 [Candidatus Bathyarchaeota archaeon]|jgi:hypothetical protein|nr:hypothetical protein [Candidatus Bathyarchaeota archaeon]
MQKKNTGLAKWAHRINIARIAGYVLLCLGAAALIVAVGYESQILAFTGLGLVFWGIILAYIQTSTFVKEDLLDATALSSLATINQLLQQAGYTAKAVYLPPKYFKDLDTCKAFIPKQDTGSLPTPEQIQEQENNLFIENPQGILLPPIGGELTKLFEKTLETSFTRIDLPYLQQNMPKLFIEELEIAQNLEIEKKDNTIRVRVENTNYTYLAKKASALLQMFQSLGCPLSSAIACSLAKTTGKPVIIDSLQTSENGKNINMVFRLLEEEQAEQ